MRPTLRLIRVLGRVPQRFVLGPLRAPANERIPADRNFDFLSRGAHMVEGQPGKRAIRQHVLDALQGDLSAAKVEFGGGAGQPKVRPERCYDQGDGHAPNQVPENRVALEGGRTGPNHERGHARPDGLDQRLGVHESPGAPSWMMYAFEDSLHRIVGRSTGEGWARTVL